MGEPKNVHHSLDSDTDENGWWWGTCACGWQQGPFPDSEDVADAYGDHRAFAATQEASRD